MKSVKANGVFNIIKQCSNIIFPLLVFPYVSRKLGPDSYGIYSFSNSIVAYFILTAMLGVNLYAIREGARIRDDNKEFQKFASEVSTINFASTLISWVVLVLVALIGNFQPQTKVALLVLSLIVPSTFLGRDWINNIFEDYAYITIRYIVIQCIGLIFIYTLIHNRSDWLTYTVIYMLTTSGGYYINLIYCQRYCRFKLTLRPNKKKHLIPILVLFAGQMAATLYIQSDITMIGIFSTNEQVGIYTIASKIYVLAKAMINALTTVVVPRISYYLGKRDETNYNHIANKLSSYLFMLILPASVGLFVLSNNVILLVGGFEYVSGAKSLSMLSAALPIAVFAGYFCNAIMIPNLLEKKFMFITIISALVNIGLNIFLIPLMGIEGAAVTTIISEVIVVCFGYFYTRKLLEIRIDKRNLFLTILGSILVAIICIICTRIKVHPYIQLIIAIPVSVIFYFLIHIIFKTNLVTETASTIYRKITKE